ncbi:MAG: xanthine dehydrogenase family protein molybdopterin-binding subunit [Actinomycetota bacterium]|nr:xanthine dehydrogenase family protein molybdopterin-binding subunit [Actinomycetota bacterium]
MARLIRTEKEVEGRYTEQWVVVEEDVLDQWPAGPRDVVGRDAPRVDALQRARGEATYTADVRFPGMLHTAVLRSPHARARVRRLTADRALAAPGVRGILTPRELSERDAQDWPGEPSVDEHPSEVLTAEPGYAGAPIAAVAADTFGQAAAAIALIDVDWEVLEPVFDPDEAVRRGLLLGDPRRYDRGDLEQGLAEADVVVEAEYRTQVVLHNSLETHQSVCRWEGDALEVYTSTQWIWGVRDDVSEALGLPPDKVRVVCNYMGGGFGSKNHAGDYTFIAAELARRTGRPVRSALTRREENQASGNRNATIQRLVAGARADGTLTALGGEFVNAVGYDGFSALTGGPMQLLYSCPNVRTTEYGAQLNTPPNAAFRAPGFVEGTFGLECLLDEVAAKLDLDPLELRRRNHADHDAVDARPFSSKNLLACYRRAEPHWERRHDVRASSEGSWRRGVGLASQVWYGGGGPPSYAWVRIGSDARATVITAMQDIGTGTRTAMAQIAAEELGLPLDAVEVQLGDSARGPYASISAGSSTTPSMGPAVRAAAADAARQIIEIAAQRYHREERVLSLRGGHVVSADGGSWPLQELTGLLGTGQILGKGARGPNPTGMRVLTFGIQVAEVAVDVETGEVRVERIAAIHDIGRVINPLNARSQVEGGIIQGLGHTLSEQRLLDPQSGYVLSQTLDAYKLPTSADMPDMVVEFVDEPDEHLTNLGAKGLGEPPIIPTAAAIANAIRDATGADVRSLPVTREEMLRALRDARERQRDAATFSGVDSLR